MRRTNPTFRAAAVCFTAAFFFILCFLFLRAYCFPRPHADLVAESGVPPSLAFAVMKTESNFREDAVSAAGAVGIMQLLPSTAEFVCRREGVVFCPDRLKEGKYNVFLGCAYLKYLLERFRLTETALAAYNAGEGTVAEWLKNSAYSADGIALQTIPYPETRNYIEKVKKFRKIYDFIG